MTRLLQSMFSLVVVSLVVVMPLQAGTTKNWTNGVGNQEFENLTGVGNWDELTAFAADDILYVDKDAACNTRSFPRRIIRALNSTQDGTHRGGSTRSATP